MADQIAQEIMNEIESMNHNPDASCYGNQIGVVMGRYLDEEKFGWDKECFLSGLMHGISLSDGSHDS